MKGFPSSFRELVARSDLLVAFVIIALPILLIAACSVYTVRYGVGSFELISAIAAYYLSDISVGIGLHRLWAHGAYKAHPILSKILIVTSTFCLQGSVLKWASDHKRHHAYADTEKDPHTPVTFPDSKLKGFLWAHLGWMIIDSPLSSPVDDGTMKTLGKDRWLRVQYKYYGLFATILNVPVPFLIGYLCGGDLHHAFTALLFIGLGRALQQQMTFAVNSVCHMLGRRPYASDSSGDIFWLAPLLFGENWHNFHHAFGNDYRCGHKWYHLDVHKWIIWSLSKVGLAHNLVATSAERIRAIEREMLNSQLSETSSRLADIERTARVLLEQLGKKLGELRVDVIDVIGAGNTESVGIAKKMAQDGQRSSESDDDSKTVAAAPSFSGALSYSERGGEIWRTGVSKARRKLYTTMQALSQKADLLRLTALNAIQELERNATSLQECIVRSGTAYSSIAHSSLLQLKKLVKKAQRLGISVSS